MADLPEKRPQEVQQQEEPCDQPATWIPAAQMGFPPNLGVLVS